MKKIVGIIAAVAMIATTVFAADISAKVQLEGNLFTYGADKKVTMFDINKPSAQHWNPIFNLSANGDKAGASFVVLSGDDDTFGGWNGVKKVGAKNWSIWFSPADGFKFIFGHNAFNLNQEHITWSKSASGIESDGYAINFASDGFSIDAMLAPGLGNPWFSKADGADAAIAETGVKLQFGADFGTVNAILDAKANFKDLMFGAGYANNFDGLNMFVNVLGYMNNGFNKLRAEIYAEGSVDSFGWKIFPVVEFAPNGFTYDASMKVNVPLWARVDFALDAFNVYVEIDDPQGILLVGKDTNLDNGDGFIAKVGGSGNCGGAGWDVALKFNVTSKVAISVPVSFNYGW